MRRSLEVARDNWFILSFTGSIVLIILGWALFRISPLLPLLKKLREQHEIEQADAQDEFRANALALHLGLGESFLDASLISAATNEFEEALRIDPISNRAQFGLLKARLFSSSITSDGYDPMVRKRRIEHLLREKPNDKHALLHLGITYMKIEPDRAIDYFERALEQDPALVAARLDLGVIYQSRRDYQRAIAMYKRCIEVAEWHPEALNNIGHTLVMSGNYDEAIKHLEKALKLAPLTAIMYWNLSNAQRYAGKHEDAYAKLKHLVRIVADDEIMNIPNNYGDWLFEADIGKELGWAEFELTSQKRLYSIYSLALSAHLTGRHSETGNLVSLASEFDCAEREPAARLLSSNIATLKSLQQHLSHHLDAFADQLANSGNDPYF
ncbi:tetratricopeptide repeat protein [Micromonospora oryzae]|uniref:tetratricopeptide repeat protein n=1 Tax=Micromonospora sp. DSM 102119 TaxID=3111768 RepID=UPI0031E24983